LAATPVDQTGADAAKKQMDAAKNAQDAAKIAIEKSMANGALAKISADEAKIAMDKAMKAARDSAVKFA
jgi:hypothetical protein